MCGRYEFNDEKDIEEVYKILMEVNKTYRREDYKTGEIFPTNQVPILALSREKRPVLRVMKWGFPKWDGKGVIINAKSETAAEKRMFSAPLMERRCVIPSTGFYEWNKKTPGKEKEKFLFRTGEGPMLYLAGLYQAFQENGLLKESFVILTQNANPTISDIHDRMPVVLYRRELESWLKDAGFMETAFRREDVLLQRTAV